MSLSFWDAPCFLKQIATSADRCSHLVVIRAGNEGKLWRTPVDWRIAISVAL